MIISTNFEGTAFLHTLGETGSMQEKKVYYIIIMFLCLVFGFKRPLHAQNERFKALFIYNFTKHIMWPGEYNENSFVIGVLGTSPILNELNQIASRKNVNGQPIVVEKYSSVKQIGRCHMLYIPPYNSSKLNAVLAELGDRPVVVITDEFMQGNTKACINFIMKEGFLDFEISKDNLQKRGLKVNPKLISLGNEKD